MERGEHQHLMAVKTRIRGFYCQARGKGRRNINNKLESINYAQKVKCLCQTQKLTRKMRLAMRPILCEDMSGACDGEHDVALVESQNYWIGGLYGGYGNFVVGNYHSVA